MSTTCQHCGAETSNGLALCERCQTTLRTALVNTAAYYADVDRIRPGRRVKAKSAYRSTPPPRTEPATDRIGNELDYAATIVFGWCRNLEDDRPGYTRALPTPTHLRCAWLEQYVSTIATLPWAVDCLTEMRHVERRLRRILDQSDTGHYVGVCGSEIGRETTEAGDVVALTCPRHLYRPPTSTWVVCPECGRSWDAAERHRVMMTAARDELAPIRVIARVVVALTDEPSVERLTRRIEQWVVRKRLSDYGVRVLDGHPRRVYRIDDVLRLVLGESERSDADAC